MHMHIHIHIHMHRLFNYLPCFESLCIAMPNPTPFKLVSHCKRLELQGKCMKLLACCQVTLRAVLGAWCRAWWQVAAQIHARKDAYDAPQRMSLFFLPPGWSLLRRGTDFEYIVPNSTESVNWRVGERRFEDVWRILLSFQVAMKPEWALAAALALILNCQRISCPIVADVPLFFNVL